MTKGGSYLYNCKLLEGMCVFESSNEETCSSSTSPIHESDADSRDIQIADSAITHILDTFPLNEEDNIVSPHIQYETLPDVAENNTEEHVSVLYSLSISASESKDLNYLVSPLSKTLSIVEEGSDTSTVLEKSSQEVLSKSSDINQDEEHFDISLQIPSEPVFSNDEQSLQEPIEMGGESHGPYVMVPSSEGCTVKNMLPLSPKETEAFDEQISLEALDSLEMESGHEVLSQDLQNVDTTPFVKEELKERIKLRRQKKGLPDLKVREETPKPDILTAEEEEKRRIRRERNRIAAAKCRRKKKEKATVKKNATQMLREQNLALLDELSQLMDEKAYLQAMWRSHMKECKRTDLLQLQMPEVTSVMVRALPELELSDSDSIGEDMLMMNEDSTDSSSIDLTDDVGEQVIESSLLNAVTENTEPSTSEYHLQEAVNLLNSWTEIS